MDTQRMNGERNPPVRDLRLKSVSIWDATPTSSVPQRWSELTAVVRPSQVAVMVELGTRNDAATGIAGLTRYFEVGADSPNKDHVQAVADRWCGVDALALQHASETARNPYEPKSEWLNVIVELAAVDALGKLLDVPATTLLGSRARSRLATYASLPSFSTVEQALSCVSDAQTAEFSAVKFHGSGQLELDLLVIRAVRKHFGPDLDVMWDGGCSYDLDTAIAVGRALTDIGALWFEAPMGDDAGTALRILATRVGVPLVPDGMIDRSPGDVALDVHERVWSSVRFDVTRSLSLSRATRLLRLAEALGVPAEVQSFGFPLARHANLQLMFTSASCRYYESPFPDTLTDPICLPPVIDRGMVVATDRPGLGHNASADSLRLHGQLIAESVL